MVLGPEWYAGLAVRAYIYGSLVGHVDPLLNQVSITILDQGIGIPQSMEPNVFEMIKTFLKVNWYPSDGNMIAAAAELLALHR